MMRPDNELLAEAYRRETRQVEKAERVIGFALLLLVAVSVLAATLTHGKAAHTNCPPELNQYKNIKCYGGNNE